MCVVKFKFELSTIVDDFEKSIYVGAKIVWPLIQVI
jgi:hypothetical protein